MKNHQINHGELNMLRFIAGFGFGLTVFVAYHAGLHWMTTPESFGVLHLAGLFVLGQLNVVMAWLCTIK